jgi:hypothetical protein
MREILFRGKWIANGKWLEGGFHSRFGKAFIIGISKRLNIDGREVDPETVGQYTGLTVPSGKIFEHDIVTAKFKSNGARFNFTVKYSNEKGCYVFDNGCVKVPFCDIRSVRIIGNIHDNPELLKGEQR